MRLSKVSTVHRVQQEARAIIQLRIPAMKMGDCIALGRTQLLFYLVNCVMNKALKLVSFSVRHLIFCHRVIRCNCLFTKALVHSKERSVFVSISSFPLGLSSSSDPHLRPNPSISRSFLSRIPMPVVTGWRKWVMWWPLWSLLVPLTQLPTPLEPPTNHPHFQIQCVNLAEKCTPANFKYSIPQTPSGMAPLSVRRPVLMAPLAQTQKHTEGL